MSREISIGFYRTPDAPCERIEVGAPYYLFGTQQTSKEFWGLPRLREIGISRLIELAVVDPIYFIGWEDMAELGGEISRLLENASSIEFFPELKARFIAHLAYCHQLLIATAPRDSTPELTIG